MAAITFCQAMQNKESTPLDDRSGEGQPQPCETTGLSRTLATNCQTPNNSSSMLPPTALCWLSNTPPHSSSIMQRPTYWLADPRIRNHLPELSLSRGRNLCKSRPWPNRTSSWSPLVCVSGSIMNSQCVPKQGKGNSVPPLRHDPRPSNPTRRRAVPAPSGYACTHSTPSRIGALAEHLLKTCNVRTWFTSSDPQFSRAMDVPILFVKKGLAVTNFVCQLSTMGLENQNQAWRIVILLLASLTLLDTHGKHRAYHQNVDISSLHLYHRWFIPGNHSQGRMENHPLHINYGSINWLGYAHLDSLNVPASCAFQWFMNECSVMLLIVSCHLILVNILTILMLMSQAVQQACHKKFLRNVVQKHSL